MLGIIKALTDVGNYIKELKTYLGLKNQVLFSGHWTTASVTQNIPDIIKYNTLKIFPWENYDGIFLYKISDTVFSGEGMVRGVSTSNTHTSIGIELHISGSTVTIESWNGLHHVGGSNHSSTFPLEIVKIVGIDPIIPQTLSKLGGGIDTVRGWLYAISKTMSQGYSKLYQNIRQQFTNWQSASTMGNIVQNDCRKGRRQQCYSIFKKLHSNPRGVHTINSRNKFCGVVGVWCKKHYNDTIRYDVSQSIYSTTSHNRKLDCNRQSIAPRGCCYA